MLRRLLVGALAVGAVGLSIFSLQQPEAEAAAGKARKKLLFFHRSQGFEHSVVKVVDGKPCFAENVLRQFCEENGWDLTSTKDGTIFTPENIAAHDAFLFYTTGDLTLEQSKDNSRPMSKEAKANLLKAIEGGKGWVGFHCASDTFHAGERYKTQPVSERDPYINMCGGEFIVHGAQQSTRMKVVDPRFPGAAPLGEGFEKHEEWYALKNFADNLRVILVTETAGMTGGMYQRPPFPGTWARMHGQGRVFYTSMGHREDVWTSPEFKSIVVGGIKWATREVDADVTPNIASVTPQAETVPAQEIKPPKAAPKKNEKKK